MGQYRCLDLEELLFYFGYCWQNYIVYGNWIVVKKNLLGNINVVNFNLIGFVFLFCLYLMYII